MNVGEGQMPTNVKKNTCKLSLTPKTYSWTSKLWLYVSQLLGYGKIEFAGHLKKMAAISKCSKIWSASNLQNGFLGI